MLCDESGYPLGIRDCFFRNLGIFVTILNGGTNSTVKITVHFYLRLLKIEYLLLQINFFVLQLSLLQ